jgi:hypothetical protein
MVASDQGLNPAAAMAGAAMLVVVLACGVLVVGALTDEAKRAASPRPRPRHQAAY